MTYDNVKADVISCDAVEIAKAVAVDDTNIAYIYAAIVVASNGV